MLDQAYIASNLIWVRRGHGNGDVEEPCNIIPGAMITT